MSTSQLIQEASKILAMVRQRIAQRRAVLSQKDTEVLASIQANISEIQEVVSVPVAVAVEKEEDPLPINEALVITPVAQKFKKAGMPDSKRDYLEQCNRKCQGLPLCWDDSKNNTASVGDLFGFWHHNNGVEIHQIKAVHSPLHRLDTWSDNVGQGDRNVIMLSPMICKIPWDIWFPEDKLGGAQRCMGTTSVLSNLDRIVAYVRGIHM